ncbi:MAG: fibronectin type III domain-containing protein [Clostridium sp.]|nr:fibronectin type III domain-containing protein [Clostridium sp.]
MKKLISIIISIAMLFTIVSGIDISAFAAEYKQGIDVSEWNENFDFENAKNDGNAFAMIRIGYYNYLDKYFWRNVEAAYNAKINFGFYLYSEAFDEKEAKIEAQFVIDTLSQLGKYADYFTLPVAYDLESSRITDPKLGNCGKTQITKNMTTFCNAIKSAGYIPMVYANLNWFTNYIDLSKAVNNGYEIWYANYNVSNPDFADGIEIGSTKVMPDMWQYTDSDGLDKNVVYPSISRYSSIGCVHTYSIKTVAPTCTAQGYKSHTCSKCGHSYKDTFKSTVAHKTKTVVSKKATTSANGEVQTKCSVCGKVTKKTTVYKISSIKLNYSSLTYNGKTRSVGATIKDSKGKTLKSGTDYTITWASGRKNVGKYSAKITFKGNYSGSKTLYLTINPKNTSLSSVSAGSKKFTVKWKKYTTQTTGYQIQYSTDKNFKKNNKTVTVSSNKTTSKTISKLSSKKKYYVRIRTYKTVSGTKYYSSWSSAKSVTTKK